MTNVMRLLNSPRKFFIAGLVCVLLGFILPFLIVLGFIRNTFALSFFIYFLQVVGMILGMFATAGLAINRRKKDAEKQVDTSENEDERESTIGWMQ